MRRWRCKKCYRIYKTSKEAFDCSCPPLNDERIEELATNLIEQFTIPLTLDEVMFLLDDRRKKYKKPKVDKNKDQTTFF